MVRFIITVIYNYLLVKITETKRTEPLLFREVFAHLPKTF